MGTVTYKTHLTDTYLSNKFNKKELVGELHKLGKEAFVAEFKPNLSYRLFRAVQENWDNGGTWHPCGWRPETNK